MWQLKNSEGNKRTYHNPATGSECSQTMCYTDKDGNKWWNFDDLMALPFTRTMAATKVSSLYALGLSKDDLSKHIDGLKTILRSKDAEKYDKAMANVLEFQTKAENATDAVKQLSSLCTVYFTLNDEHIDSYDNNLQIRKMSLMEADVDMHAFFLNKVIDLTSSYTNTLNLISSIVSQKPNELSVVSG